MCESQAAFIDPNLTDVSRMDDRPEHMEAVEMPLDIEDEEPSHDDDPSEEEEVQFEGKTEDSTAHKTRRWLTDLLPQRPMSWKEFFSLKLLMLAFAASKLASWFYNKILLMFNAAQ